MSLADDLRSYMDDHGQAAIEPGTAEVVIVGESHQHLKGAWEFATTAMRRVVRELMKDQRFRYFGAEHFQNAGPVRQAIRDYLLRAVLPPDFDPDAPDADSMNEQEVGARVMPRRFQPILDDLRAKRYILAIGSRMQGEFIRDRRLAQHFFEEIADRRITRSTPGVLLLGAQHAAAKPFRKGQTPTRMILEQHGYHCTSILLMTDVTFITADKTHSSNDSVYPTMASGKPPQIRLSYLTSESPIFFNTRLAGSPFFQVRLERSDSGNSIADEYEYMVLEKQ